VQHLRRRRNGLYNKNHVVKKVKIKGIENISLINTPTARMLSKIAG